MRIEPDYPQVWAAKEEELARAKLRSRPKTDRRRPGRPTVIRETASHPQRWSGWPSNDTALAASGAMSSWSSAARVAAGTESTPSADR